MLLKDEIDEDDENMLTSTRISCQQSTQSGASKVTLVGFSDGNYRSNEQKTASRTVFNPPNTGGRHRETEPHKSSFDKVLDLLSSKFLQYAEQCMQTEYTTRICINLTSD